MKELVTKAGTVQLPAFFPDATCGFIKSVDPFTVENTGTPGLVMNTFHLLRLDLIETIHEAGGLHAYTNWRQPIITDSGGFQVLSLIRRTGSGKVIEPGLVFNIEGKELLLTPELCIDVQVRLGSDIIMVLDDCTDPQASFEEQQEAVERTIRWARRCKKRFVQQTKDLKQKPLLFGIVQGGNHKELRKRCAEELLKIGFNGMSFGGWPVENGVFLHDIVSYTASLIPDTLPKYAMGVGKPEDIVACFNMGYDLFDCVIPTRDARHKKFFVFNDTPEQLDLGKPFYTTYNLGIRRHGKDLTPLAPFCDCHTCQHYSKSYVMNLFKNHDPLARRLATIHNLRFYAKLLELLQRTNTHASGKPFE